jgi:predicted lipid-binding transport protein (Tim44 family)
MEIYIPSAGLIVVGLVLGILFGGLMLAFRNRPRDVFAVALIAGIAAIAVVVTIDRVSDFRAQEASDNSVAGHDPTVASGSSTEQPPREPLNLPTPGPGLKGASGSAAPAAVRNPYRLDNE